MDDERQEEWDLLYKRGTTFDDPHLELSKKAVEKLGPLRKTRAQAPTDAPAPQTAQAPTDAPAPQTAQAPTEPGGVRYIL